MRLIKKIILLVISVLFIVSLTGCRQRVIMNGEADRVIVDETPKVSEPPEESAPPEESDPPVVGDTESKKDTDDTESKENPDEEKEDPNGDDGKTDESGGPNKSNVPDESGKTEGIAVTLDANGGECAVKKIAVTSSEPYGELPAATRSGYSFVGWYTAKSGGKCVTEDTIVSNTKPHKLYAMWTVRADLAVAFDANGGRIKSKDASRTITTGDEYGELPTPLREGYDFEGWFTSASAGQQIFSTSIFLGSKDQTLYAHWQYNPYKYWSFVLANDVQQMYSCQAKSVYIEFDEHETTTWCSLIDATRSENIAANRGDGTTVTDEWVNEKNPDVVVKVANNMGNAGSYYSEMTSRFPGRQALIVPSEAIYGSDTQKLFYALSFGKLLYGDWFSNFDADTAASELGVSGRIYG